MHSIEHIYINGAFVRPHGSERRDIVNPATGEHIGYAILGNAEDAERAVAAAKQAQTAFAASSVSERIAMLRRLHDSVLAAQERLFDATVEEYGGIASRASWVSKFSAQSFLDAASVLEQYALERREGVSLVAMEPVGISVLITPWNSASGSICSKLAMAIAAGCTTVIKPSEMSAIQTHAITQALHDAGLPPGVINVVIGRGDVVGAALCSHPDVARISFTGSTTTGKAIAQIAAGGMKRMTLALSGKSPTLILDDADLSTAVPAALAAAFGNSGQACVAGSRLLVPQEHLDEVLRIIRQTVAGMRVGDPHDAGVSIGPMASQAQYDRIRDYIRIGIEEGATLVTGGLQRPQNTAPGFFVQPTVFSDVRNNMRIAQEEIFGPVLCVLTFADQEEAIRIANDTPYGLHAYVFSKDLQRAQRVAKELKAGRVAINGAQHDPLAPFGGYKQSGMGREYGVLGLESFLEAKAILTP